MVFRVLRGAMMNVLQLQISDDQKWEDVYLQNVAGDVCRSYDDDEQLQENAAADTHTDLLMSLPIAHRTSTGRLSLDGA
ncbi:hypothetical protein DOTSEDRAFT_70559 [Dothistroma septosporum NZE10]|uniref:Uncharacterized protein n=1 Tax=Dothistroma septosporum (strain NZE10 / CBS 128990) TaxID=675120 RepID=N1PT86_DOTSN|nr:hypothetical protein DOTSEDRAFT_70559 [Dothistroma septosporum NZE10]